MCIYTYNCHCFADLSERKSVTVKRFLYGWYHRGGYVRHDRAHVANRNFRRVEVLYTSIVSTDLAITQMNCWPVDDDNVRHSFLIHCRRIAGIVTCIIINQWRHRLGIFFLFFPVCPSLRAPKHLIRINELGTVDRSCDAACRVI